MTLQSCYLKGQALNFRHMIATGKTTKDGLKSEERALLFGVY